MVCELYSVQCTEESANCFPFNCAILRSSFVIEKISFGGVGGAADRLIQFGVKSLESRYCVVRCWQLHRAIRCRAVSMALPRKFFVIEANLFWILNVKVSAECWCCRAFFLNCTNSIKTMPSLNLDLIDSFYSRNWSELWNIELKFNDDQIMFVLKIEQTKPLFH